MKRIGCMFLAVLLSLTLVITPVMAKGGNGGGGSSGGGKSSSVSSGNSGGGEKGSSVSPGNSGSKESSGVKDNSNNKADSSKPSQSKKDSNLSSSKKTTEGIDLSRGNKDLVQQRIQSREVQTVPKQFKDTKGHWAQNSIQKVQQLELIKGYDDGSFNPDAAVSQAEAIVMVVNLAELIDENADITDDVNTVADPVTDDTITDDGNTDENTEDEKVDDVPSWARNQARKASTAGIININRFHSEVQASRAQTAVMLAKALELEPVEVDEDAFTDSLKITPEDIGYIMALKEAGIINGTPDGKFNPNSAITRAEIAAMLAKIAENIEDKEEGSGDTAGDTTNDTTAAQTNNLSTPDSTGNTQNTNT